PGEQPQPGEQPEQPEQPDDNQNNNQGQPSNTSGDVVYSSTETIYNPTTGESSQYGDSLVDYYARALNSYISGEMSEAEWNVIYQYYTALFNNIPEQSEAEE
ncbi:MAG: hypothetical protein J6X75_05445, partial [Clostridia bacterium]|nr:hypothetical protein [Clostridia bacterium]